MSGIKSDKWIRDKCEALPRGVKPMIDPFEAGQVRYRIPRGDDGRLVLGSEYDPQKVISYGTSSYGYDIRCAREFKIFTNVHSTIVDPKNFDEKSFVDFEGDSCIIPPNSFALARSVEYLRIPRDILVVCLGKSTYARCFSGSTKVALVSGESLSFKDMVRQAKEGKRFFGYGISPESGIKVVELEAPRKIAKNEKLLRVTLDNGESIDCTPDHKFLTRSRGYVQAKELTVGNSLMPLYRYESREREVVYDPVREVLEATYRLSDAYNVRHKVYKAGKNQHRHHVDHNKRNDRPDNIERLDATVHTTMHNEEYYGVDFDSLLHSQRIRSSLTKLALDPDWLKLYAQAQSKRAIDFWTNPKYAKKRALLSKKQKAIWADPVYKKNMSEARKKFWNSKEGKRVVAERKMPKRIPLSRKRVELALMSTGSILQAANLMGVSKRTVRARFPNMIKRLKGTGVIQSGDRITLSLKEAERALRSTGSINAASKLLGISGPTLSREAAEVIRKLRKKGVIPESNHKVVSIQKLKDLEDVYCLTTETGNFALEAGVFVKNCGIIVNVTPLEPEWEGHITLEFSNTTPLPARIYANEGVAQLLFFQADPDDICDMSYRDRGGKYQGQTGVTLPKS